MKTDFKFSLGICALLLAVGCSNTADGAAKDVQSNAQQTADAAKKGMDSASNATKDMSESAKESAGDVGAATLLTPRLKTAITADAMLNDSRNSINVDSTNDKVTLTGYVYKADLKAHAEDVVKKEMTIVGAKQTLTNSLEVKPEVKK